MVQQVIDVGVNADDGTGDSLYVSGNKINANFNDFFDLVPVKSDIKFFGNNITSRLSNADIDVHPSGTGSIVFPGIRFNDNNIEVINTNDDIKIIANGSGRVTIAGLAFGGTTISSDDSSTININENVIVDGSLSVEDGFTFSGAKTFATGMDIATLTLGNGSIVDSTGAISFGNENLTTTGTVTAGTSSTIGNLTLANGSITDSGGSISFGNENLTTTGTLSGGTGSTLGNLTFANGSITDSSGAISFGNENLTTTGTMTVGTLAVASGSITDSSGAISFGNENLTTTGTLTAATGSTLGNLTFANGSITDSSGAISFGNENLTTTGTSFEINSTLTVANGSITDSSGAISFGDENVTTTGTIARATGSTIGNLTLANGSITDSSGAISFGNENLTTTATSIAINSTLTVANGSITDSSGAISFGNENVTTTGTIARATGSTIGNLTLANGSITDSGGSISFGNENLTTTGTSIDINSTLTVANGSITDSSGAIDFGNENVSTTGTIARATGSTIGNLTFANGSITDSGGSISFGNENVTTSASSMAINNTLTAGSGAITDSTGEFTFGNENLTTTGTLDVSGLSTFDSMAVSGATSFADSITVDNLTFNDNIISTSSNADLRLSPGGTGVVNVSNLTIDSSLSFKDNVLKVTTSNADLELAGSGTGLVQISGIDLNSGTIDNVVVGANEPAAGAFDPLNFTTLVIPNKITFSGNTMSTNRSNDNLEFEANGSGRVVINDFKLPGADGDTGGFIRTDGSKDLSYFVNSISFSESTIVDAKNTIGFTTEVVLDANLSTGENESITAGQSMINDFSQSKYDSAWYIALSRLEAADSSIEFQMQKHIVAQGTADGSTFDAFSGSSQIIRTSDDEEVLLATDVRAASGKVRLLGQGGTLADGSTTSAINTLHFFRIGLGDNDSSGAQAGSTTLTQQQTLLVTDLDSAAANLDTFAADDFRGAKYFISINNTTTNEVESTEVLVVHDGTNAFIQEFNTVISNPEITPLATFTADISGGNVRLRGANGTAGVCRVTMYRVLLADDETTRSGTPIAIVGATSIGQLVVTDVDHVTSTIVSRQGFGSEEIFDEFDSSKYDSAWYLTLAKDMTSGRLAFHKYSVLHGTSDDSSIEGFISNSSVVRSEEFDVVTADVGVDDGNIQLKLTGINDGSTTVQNFINSYRIGLGDDDSTGYAGDESALATVEINADVDSASESIDTFAHADHRGAKYFVSVMNASGGEVMNIELLVVHDGSAAYITTYNEHSSGNTGAASTDVLATFTAAISGDNVVVSAAGLDTNLRIHMYRILLADDQTATTGTNVNVISAVTVSSSATTIDTFSTNTYAAAHYIIIGSAGDGKSIMEATVISDGTEASVSEGPQVSTKGTAQLQLTASHSSTTTTLQASSTSGASTTVNSYRIHIPVPAGTQFTEIDSFAHASTQGALYVAVTHQTDNKSAIDEIMVVTDGTDAYNHRHGINTDSATSNITNWTSVVDGDNVKVRATLADTTAGGTINAWQVHLDRAAGNPSNIATIDTFNKTTHRSAVYNVSVSDPNSGALGNFETLEARVTHDGTDAYVSTFGRTSSTGSDLVTFSADVNSNDVRLRGQISTSNTHEVIVVRRLINV